MFIARVTFLGREKGGRRTRPASGYHPQIDAGGEYTSCAIESLNEELVFEFDRVYTVKLRLLFPEPYRDKFASESAVRFHEGSHLVGHGTILEIQ